MRPALLVLALLLPAAPAFASGGMSCEGKSGDVSFSISSAITRGMGSPLFNFAGTLETGFDEISADLRTLTYDGDEVAQWWIDDKQLNILLYVERLEGLFGSTELTITTQAVDEGLYEGQFEISAYDSGEDEMDEAVTAQASGKVTCMAE